MGLECLNHPLSLREAVDQRIAYRSMEKSSTSHISAKSRTAIAILGVLPGLNKVMLLQSNDQLIFLASFFYSISMQANCSYVCRKHPEWV